MAEIGFDTFEQVDIRVGTVTRAEPFPEARKPAIKLWVDFGDEVGIRKSSARITDHYAPETLVGKQVMGVVNFPPRQIGPFMSEALVLGFADAQGAIVLAIPDHDTPNGARLC
ncbi:tRNA-binding protein [Marivita sp.]|uniref:tRNA-binding protein n=1 Tax=Marivita sp. TaxID=2003365 RepID=UPI0025C0E5FE|nr:tRNA-binding protein [Marivita sp.]